MWPVLHPPPLVSDHPSLPSGRILLSQLSQNPQPLVLPLGNFPSSNAHLPPWLSIPSYPCCIDKYLLKHSISFFNLFIYFNWRLIILQYCGGFCHTLTWISHGCTCVLRPEPASHLPPHPIPLSCPSSLASSALFHASNLHWSSISHMVIYMFSFLFLENSGNSGLCAFVLNLRKLVMTCLLLKKWESEILRDISARLCRAYWRIVWRLGSYL